jgi:hypothetical protein
VPLVIWLPLNVPPDAPETLAVQDVALVEVQVAVTASPRLMLAAAAGCEKLTVGARVGAALPPDPYPLLLPPPPHPASAMPIDPNAIVPHVETRMPNINLFCQVIAHGCSDVADLLCDFGDRDTVLIAETSARTFGFGKSRTARRKFGWAPRFDEPSDQNPVLMLGITQRSTCA